MKRVRALGAFFRSFANTSFPRNKPTREFPAIRTVTEPLSEGAKRVPFGVGKIKGVDVFPRDPKQLQAVGCRAVTVELSISTGWELNIMWSNKAMVRVG